MISGMFCMERKGVPLHPAPVAIWGAVNDAKATTILLSKAAIEEPNEHAKIGVAALRTISAKTELMLVSVMCKHGVIRIEGILRTKPIQWKLPHEAYMRSALASHFVRCRQTS